MPVANPITIKDDKNVDHVLVPVKFDSPLVQFAEKLSDGVTIGFPRVSVRAEEVTTGIKSSVSSSTPVIVTDPATAITRTLRTGRLLTKIEWDKTSTQAERDADIVRHANMLLNSVVRSAITTGESFR